MEDIVREVLKSISPGRGVEGDEPLELEESQEPVPLSVDNFGELPGRVDGSVAFVDGGNAELFGASSFSLQLVRAAVVTYEGTEKIRRLREDFHLLISFSDDEFSVRTFPGDVLPDLRFDSFDPRLRTGNERIPAQRVAGVCRRLFELRLASEADSDIVVLDGELYARAEQEEPFLDELRGSGSVVCGLSKTSGLMTEQGRVVGAALSGMKEGAWSYHPLYEDGDVAVSFARLHPDSDHVFRVDLFDDSDLDSVLGTLRGLSADPVFLGYPYGLLEADRHARISKREAEYERTKLMTQFGDDWRDVKAYLHTRDAHEILDNIG